MIVARAGAQCSIIPMDDCNSSHLRSVSAETSDLCAIEAIAGHGNARKSWCSIPA
jgi:hypothetical protein